MSSIREIWQLCVTAKYSMSNSARQASKNLLRLLFISLNIASFVQGGKNIEIRKMASERNAIAIAFRRNSKRGDCNLEAPL